MSSKIYAPTVHLFAFDLRESNIITINARKNHLEREKEKVRKLWLWEICNEIIEATLQNSGFKLINYLDLDKRPTSFRVALRDRHKLQQLLKEFPNIKNSNFYIEDAIPLQGQLLVETHKKIEIQGFAYPKRINNSYGLWLTLGHPKWKKFESPQPIDISFLRQINPKNLFFSHTNRGFFGRLILITSWLPPKDTRRSKEELKELAQECVKNFFPEGYEVPQLNREGELFGSPIFQFGTEKNLPSSGSIFICFFRGKKTHNKFYESREKIFDLFFHRAEIITAFQQFIKVSKSLERLNKRIESEVTNLTPKDMNKTLSPQKLNELQSNLRELPIRAQKYEQILAILNNYQNKINNNIQSYTQIMEGISHHFHEEDVTFLQGFIKNNCSFYQEQIKANLTYFRHSSGLIDKAINSIRGQLGIERTEVQKESDRNLEMTILSVGGGFGAGQIVSQVINKEELAEDVADLPPPFSMFPVNSYSIIVLSLVFSILFGMILGIVIGGFSWVNGVIEDNWAIRFLGRSKNKDKK